MAQLVKNLPAMQETQVQSLGGEDSLGEGNGNCPAAHMVHWTQGRLGATREDWKKTQGAVGTADKFIFSGQQQQQSSSSESSKTTDIQDRQKWPLASGHAGPVLPRSAI